MLPPQTTQAPPTNDSPTIRQHLSVSQLSMYARCPRQYFYRYGEGLKERPNLPMLNGTSGHTAVEYNYKKKITTGEDQPLDKILDIFSDAYDANTSVLEPSDLGPNDNLGATKDGTVETLKIWRLREAIHTEPLAVEAEFTLPIPPNARGDETPPVIGRIDLIQRAGTTDNKFAGKMKSQADVDINTQLDTYDAALIAKGIRSANVGLTVFTPPMKTKPADTRTIWRDPALMTDAHRAARAQRTLDKFRDTWRAITAGIFPPVDDPRTCSWCGYRDRCQASLVKSEAEAQRIRQETQ